MFLGPNGIVLMGLTEIIIIIIIIIIILPFREIIFFLVQRYFLRTGQGDQNISPFFILFLEMKWK